MLTGPISILNIYNDGDHSNSLHTIRRTLAEDARHTWIINPAKMIWIGDFNRHHPLWDEECNSYLFTTNNLTASQILLDLLADFNMTMSLPKDIPTLCATRTKNLTHDPTMFFAATR